MTKEEILKAIDDEPELPGVAPSELKNAFYAACSNFDYNFIVEALRISVRETKKGITNRIEERWNSTHRRRRNNEI
jgi:hypothetical protein